MANIVSPRDRHARLEAYYGMGFPDLDSLFRQFYAEEGGSP